jgi:hypothetical protein
MAIVGVASTMVPYMVPIGTCPETHLVRVVTAEQTRPPGAAPVPGSSPHLWRAPQSINTIHATPNACTQCDMQRRQERRRGRHARILSTRASAIVAQSPPHATTEHSVRPKVRVAARARAADAPAHWHAHADADTDTRTRTRTHTRTHTHAHTFAKLAEVDAARPVLVGEAHHQRRHVVAHKSRHMLARSGDCHHYVREHVGLDTAPASPRPGSGNRPREEDPGRWPACTHLVR